MKKLHVKATFIEPVLGTWPANPNVAREFIASKSPDAATIEDEVAALGKGYEVNCCAVAMHRASQRHSEEKTFY